MWINPNTLEIYTLHSEIRAAFPNVLFPADVSDDDIAAVGIEPLVASAPAYDPLSESAIELAPAKVDGVWIRRWQIVALSPEAAAENQAQAAADALDAAKAARHVQVARIKVTTASGKEFDGDETSQTRMARAILAMESVSATETHWVLATNIPTVVTLAELKEALVLSGEAQAAVWMAPFASGQLF